MKKYAIRYSPDITEEIFLQLIAKVHTDGRYFKDHCNFGNTYTAFQKNKYFRTDLRNEPSLYWCIDNNPQNLPEISISEILNVNKMSYKIGDWCYIIHEGTSRLTRGKVYQINNTSATDNYHFDIDGANNKYNSCWVRPEGIRMAHSGEIPTQKATGEWLPKEGDYAVMTKDYDMVKTGMVVKLTEPQGSGDTCWYVDFPGRGDRTPAPWLKYMRKALPHEIPVKAEERWQPKIGEYAIMTNAGGWGYDSSNNGCLAVIEKIGEKRQINWGMSPTISGRIINPNTGRYGTFTEVPIWGHEKNDLVCRKATQAEIDRYVVKKPSIPESKYKIGGWVKCIAQARSNKSASMNQFKVGEYYQIEDIAHSGYIDVRGGYRLSTRDDGRNYGIECEWVGMEKPVEKKYGKEIREAKRRFPIGTKIDNKNIIPNANGNPSVTGGYRQRGEEILVNTDSYSDFTIYKEGIWANIAYKEPVVEGLGKGAQAFCIKIEDGDFKTLELSDDWKWSIPREISKVEPLPKEIIVKKRKINRKILVC